MIIAIPERSVLQRKEALNKANDIRRQRSVLKKKIKSGQINVAALILDPPEYICNMKITNLLLAIPKLGVVRVDMIIRKAGISPKKTIGGLTDRQREDIADKIKER